MDDSDTSTSINSLASDLAPGKNNMQWRGAPHKSVDEVIDFFQKPVQPFSHEEKNESQPEPEPSISLNFIQLFNDVLLLVTRLIDVLVPHSSTNTLNFLEQVRNNVSGWWKQVLIFYRSNSYLVNISVTIFVLSIIPPVLIFILLMAVYTSFIGFLFTTGFTILAVAAGISFLPVFLISLSVIVSVTAAISLTYMAVSATINLFSSTLPTREWLSIIADALPPSVGIAEKKN
ncbi:hypothetical protein KL930_000545 [Ogataea haglerorum]|uniref:Transmembrane protein n=1 Tax=Ogataea haglerorum TaxID=1937702 RepID=A0AAN6D4I6_9ASCO|nr:uncharacterized protein KL911_000586 [Ogataea haglerorum]KAG7693533.1 hypothetical protein KL951_004554 [Ogataea haglerorum]KAG7713570.1 hypothetical protein KL913_004910 [Ogataea haglerorum]KAG7714135.1 hypothetical protein KL949_004990 [Ogataea haglerorum]KAG7725699.1 hypothetical protein KL948_004883 [Ogataea haglerorum]KAG7726742.1 hypothetical protein KL933_003025 [Ogataea haglerorum]